MIFSPDCSADLWRSEFESWQTQSSDFDFMSIFVMSLGNNDFTVLVTGMSWTLTGPLSSSESIKPPTLFPLVQCSSASQIAVGCLALDFFPENLTYQWSNLDSQQSEQYPVIAKDGSFSRVSLIRVSKSDWDAGKSYNCSVSHNGQSKNVTLKNLGGMYMYIKLHG